MGGKSVRNYFVTISGVKVYRNWEDNIIVDSQLPAIRWKAQQKKDRFTRGKAEGLSKLASVNSEDAFSWNFFRSLEKAESLDFLMDRHGFNDAFRVLYWYRLFDQRNPEAEIQSALDRIEAWGKGGRRQQTETDIILIGKKYLIMIECKLGRPREKIRAWSRKTKGSIPQEYETYVLRLTAKPNDWRETMQRFYQLLRNLILGYELGKKWNLEPHLFALVNMLNFNHNGKSHEEEFDMFRKTINIPEYAHLSTWQLLRKEIGIMDNPALHPLILYLNKHPCLDE